MLSSILLVLLSFAGQAIMHGADGKLARYWDFASVVYAEVTDIAREERDRNIPNQDYGSFRIELKPIATLAGTLDPAYMGEIHTGASIGSEISVILKTPAKGAKVLVVIERINWNDQEYFGIPNGGATFFPQDKSGHRPCLIEVTGFDDPKVTETIEKLRKLRGKQREEAEQKAAEKKSSK